MPAAVGDYQLFTSIGLTSPVPSAQGNNVYSPGGTFTESLHNLNAGSSLNNAPFCAGSYVVVTASSNPAYVYLPAATTPMIGRYMNIHNISSTNPVYVYPASGNLGNGASRIILNPLQSIRVHQTSASLWNLANSNNTATDDPTGPNFVAASPLSHVDNTTHTQILLGGLDTGNFTSYIGQSFNASGGAAPAGVNGGPSDTYVAGTAPYSSVLGGYDNIANGLASTIVGQHNRIYTAVTHGSIIGGGLHYISAGDSNTIVGGNLNIISATTGTSGTNIISGGATNTISGTSCVSGAIVGGASQTISGGSYSAIVGGFSNTISSSGIENVIIGGGSNTVSGSFNSGAVISGLSNTVGNSYAVTVGGHSNSNTAYAASVVGGESCTNFAAYSMVLGYNQIGYWTGGIHYGARIQATQGDRQNVIQAQSIQTTNATQTALSDYWNGPDNPTIPVNTAAVVRMMVIGRQLSSTNVVGYFGTAMIHRGSSGNVVVDSQTWTIQGVDGIGIAAAPALQTATASTLAILVTGKAATTIDWNSDVQCCLVTGAS